MKIVEVVKREVYSLSGFQNKQPTSTLMKKHIAKITTLSLLAAAVIATPTLLCAADVSTNALVLPVKL